MSLLAFGLADSGAGATTYSETVLGALVSPWNPMVVILPMLLLLLLAAVAATGSGLAGVGVLLVGSYVVQTDISTLPLVAVVVLLAVGTWFVGSLRGRRRRAAAVAASEAGSHWAGPQAGPPSAVLGDAGRAGGAGRARRTDRRADRRADRAGMAAAAGLVLLVAMWVPPVVEQLTHHPGNLTLLYRYFTSGAAGQSWGTALSASGAALAVFVAGPSEVMPWVLWGAQPHHALNALCLVATLGLGVGAAVAGLRSRSWFAACLGGLSAVGALVVVVAAVHVIGLLFGYLLVWAAVLPASSLVAAGAVRLPDGWVAGVRRAFGPSGARLLLVLLLAVPCSATVARVLATPPLSRASDPQV
ncbi:MAG TPA: hypothetical protein VKW77_05690, partial [Acidimicrobiales bacterium]|nr:hypothetical protein [Acidimicrobiales bacterium]